MLRWSSVLARFRAGAERVHIDRRMVIAVGSATVLGLLAVATVYNRGAAETQAAWQEHQAEKKLDFERTALTAEAKLGRIYESIRTIAALPSVRELSRHGENLSMDGRGAIQQIYNNVALGSDISEIYLIPSNFNPGRIDLKTGELEAPSVVFDEYIVDGGRYAKAENPYKAKKQDGGYTQPPAAEVESEEYAEMRSHIDWFLANSPSSDRLIGGKVPVLSTPEVITCNNIDYNVTRLDADRRGLAFSVPVFGLDGKLRGIVSAVVRTKVLNEIVDPKSEVLSSPNQKYASGFIADDKSDAEVWSPSSIFFTKGITISDVREISLPEPQGKWTLYGHYATDEFYAGSRFKNIRLLTLSAMALVVLFAFSAAAGLLLLFKRMNQAQYASLHDGLTGLANGRNLSRQFETLNRKASKASPTAVLYLDLDGFKAINDVIGHHAGDIALKVAAKRIKQCVRGADFIARVGGDEFVVLQKNGRSRKDAASLADRLIHSLSQHFEVNGRTASIGASVGIAYLEQGKDPNVVVKRADLALAKAKSDGKGRYRFFDIEMDRERERIEALKAELGSAILQDEFALVYQPIVESASSTICGVEALLRWHSPRLGTVQPLDFIKIAEETGAIHTIGEWVLKRACQDAMMMPKSWKVSVNLSPVQLKNSTLALHIVSALNQSGLSPNRLEIEVTESVFIDSRINASETLRQIQSLGVSIAIDDFGTGYSSLSYLKDYGFDRVKIDRSFMREPHNEKNEAIVRAISHLSASLGMATTSEGIETEEQLQMAIRQGCTQVQGYYFAKPMPLEQLLGMQAQIRA